MIQVIKQIFPRNGFLHINSNTIMTLKLYKQILSIVVPVQNNGPFKYYVIHSMDDVELQSFSQTKCIAMHFFV